MRKSVSQRDVAAVEMTPGGHEEPLEAGKDQESIPPGSSRVRPHPHPLELPAHEALHQRVDMFPGYPGFPQKVKRLALETASQRWQPPGSSPELGLLSARVEFPSTSVLLLQRQSPGRKAGGERQTSFCEQKWGKRQKSVYLASSVCEHGVFTHLNREPIALTVHVLCSWLEAKMELPCFVWAPGGEQTVLFTLRLTPQYRKSSAIPGSHKCRGRGHQGT